MPQPTLRTERLVLAPLTDEHLEFEVELDSDPLVMRFLLGRAGTRAEVEQAHARRIASADEVDGLGYWVGTVDGAPVGWWLLRPPYGPDQPKVAGEAELGYRLLRRYWRRGFASEGAREFVRYGFDVVGLDRIFAQTMADNTGSRATMAAVGMTFVRAFHSAEQYDEVPEGADNGEVEYDLTRARWREQRAGRAT